MKDAGVQMKIYFVTFLLLIFLILLIIFPDLLMDYNFNQALPNLRKPFEVSDPAEYVLTLLLLGTFFIKPAITYIGNKKKKSTTGK